MRNDTRAEQIQQIIERLAHLPGGQSVDVVSKRLPRMWPGYQPSSFESRQRSFTVEEVPRPISVPIDAEEVIIRLRGRLPQRDAHQGLVVEMSGFLKEMDLNDNWDIRTNVTHSDVEDRFELTLLTHDVHTGGAISESSWA